MFSDWYSYHFPELAKIVTDNYTYARVAKYIKDRKSLSDESLPALEEILMDSAKAQSVISASKSSMGECFASVSISILVKNGEKLNVLMVSC